MSVSVADRESLIVPALVLPSRARILVIRPDRLGDVVLSTPVLEVLRRFFPKATLHVLAQPRVAPILRGLGSVDRVIEVDLEGKHSGWRGFWRLVREFREGSYDLALVLQAPSRIAIALAMARVPVRLGPYSKWFSWMTYTHGMRQRRSQVEMHEADYNLQLLRPLGIVVGSRTVRTQVAISEEARFEVLQWMKDHAVSRETGSWVAIHAGMGGSALNWPEAHYQELTRRLLQDGVGVIVTGGPLEQGLLDRFSQVFSGSARFRIFGGKAASDVQRLAALFAELGVVIAPSTGPLHVAVAVGCRVVSFYPPIRVQSAKRWGPYETQEHARVFSPEAYCTQDFRCAGQACAAYPCMNGIAVDQVREEVLARVSVKNQTDR
ncbi:MAG: hypothetical protein RJB38_291 [Pseudomonadota bacterium]|jgi:ADP-heptose:LPS heptosyltransferase